MEFIDNNEIKLNKIIKRKIGSYSHKIQNKIESALQKIEHEAAVYIRKSFGDPQIIEYKSDFLFENENKKPYKVKENENIRKVLK